MEMDSCSEAAKKKKAELDVSSEPDNDFIPSINAGTSAKAAGKKKADALLEFNNDENPKYIRLELENDFWIFANPGYTQADEGPGSLKCLLIIAKPPNYPSRNPVSPSSLSLQTWLQYLQRKEGNGPAAKNTVMTASNDHGIQPRAIGGVVAPPLNVYGVENLKVADLSIVPLNVSANTYNTALIVGDYSDKSFNNYALRNKGAQSYYKYEIHGSISKYGAEQLQQLFLNIMY
ncbi:hypothetical protein BT96DRAFT_940331 [Gymnopus androsaceus JB14]|uniref:Glucose-methanol-choline oxidoreductase C-terminal domain-containing protein n=1 Tax=Gymnopus androsaceus JB14 TaxID=1447944 RepID=A0A6A4HMY7_9AGAR|nr:hypothetical protein BT96DRAFT_940331 [Gymnopus androsaceus JB14]